MTQQTILRWRIHDGKLPLRQRHMRALAKLELPDALIGWIHERLEWAMLSMLRKGQEAVLVLHIDPASEVRLTMDEPRQPPPLSPSDLRTEQGFVVGLNRSYLDLTDTNIFVDKTSLACAESDQGAGEAKALPAESDQPTRPPEPILAGDVWIERDDILIASVCEIYTATSTLCRDLATTLGIEVQTELQTPEQVQKAAQMNQAFLITDEFGFLPIGSGSSEETSTATKRICDAFTRLW
ncbi:MAG: hypothetical protein FWD45_00015 [Coriobacteriia bacterium]|nr:hypothetical protein [Coriobacteriia bacterium]